MSIDERALLRLMTWLSPAFPVGSFSYSHGLEAAIEVGHIGDREALLYWVATLLEDGSIWNDCVLLTAAHRQVSTGVNAKELIELANALAGSKERHVESVAQGVAFLTAAKGWVDLEIPENCPLPIAVGICSASNTIELKATIIAYLQSFTSNQVQAALRLMKLGQSNGVWIQKELEPVIFSVVERAEQSSLDDLGSCTFVAEIASMQHEVMPTRIFRT